MTTEEARNNIDNFVFKTNLTKSEEFLYIESLKYLIEEENNSKDMMHLGGIYYEKKKFDLALKYYSMASSYDYDGADECLGYIYYYGRVGKPDYEKAYYHYKKSADRGNITSTYKLADMYKNGYYVKKDYEVYKEMIISLYPKVKDLNDLFDPVPEVLTRLAKIYVIDGYDEEALDLYLYSKSFLAERIKYNAFFGNLTIMKWLINDLYKVVDFDFYDFDLYDLFFLLLSPCEVSFIYNDKEYTVKSVLEDSECIISFNDKWYHNIFDFFNYAKIEEYKITQIYDELYNFIYRGEK